MEVRCPFGLGNRVAAMANGLSRFPTIRFDWPVNDHCPVDHSAVFPSGVQGVEFSQSTLSVGPEMTRFDGVDVHSWGAAGDPRKRDQAYARIMGSMVGAPTRPTPRVAILGRFHRTPAGCSSDLVDRAAAWCRRLPADSAFVLCDRYRDQVSATLRSSGVVPVLPESRSLDLDLDRSPEDVLSYCSDWQTLLHAVVVIALNGPASALHPVRAAGIRIDYGSPN